MTTRAGTTAHPAVLMIATVVFVLCSCTKGPKGLSAEAYEAAKGTVAAMRRANEYRDSGGLLFEPRFLDLERAADGIAASRKSASDDSAAGMARACVDILRSYRGMLDLAPSPGDTGKSGAGIRGPLRQEAIRANLEEYMEHLTEMKKSLDDCVVQFGAYL